jgi:uncharacterized hydrophobic protein (TIGR00271 family)
VLIHVQLNVPGRLTEEVCTYLREHDWVTNLTVIKGVSVVPEGDLVIADVAREKANEILHDLRGMGLDECGGIVTSEPSGTPFAAARKIERSVAGDPDDSIIWDAVQDEAEAGARATLSFQIFLVLAVSLAAMAVIQDSSILVVGAMVVGPEFSVIAAACVGVVFLRGRLVLRSLRHLVLAFAFAILVVTLLALVGRATGVITASMLTRPRPQTDFIWHPDLWSFAVALVAGAAGALALSIQKKNVMVGVFISVTTVPAAGNLALGLAFLNTGEMVGSLAQLGANIAGMLLSGTCVLWFQRLFWQRLLHASDRFLGQREDR